MVCIVLVILFSFNSGSRQTDRLLAAHSNLAATIPRVHWSYPPWIDEERADAAREQMENDGVVYGGSLSYRHMCRWVIEYEFVKDVQVIEGL